MKKLTRIFLDARDKSPNMSFEVFRKSEFSQFRVVTLRVATLKISKIVFFGISSKSIVRTFVPRVFLGVVFLSLINGCREGDSTRQIPAVQSFEPVRYMGVWHEAARMPHWFEKGMTDVTTEYILTRDGRILVRNTGYRDGEKYVTNGYARQKRAGTGELEVSFFRPFYSDYRIIALAPDYSAALVTSSSKDYAWILVRKPELARVYLPEYTAILKKYGFDCSKLEFPSMKKP